MTKEKSNKKEVWLLIWEAIYEPDIDTISGVFSTEEKAKQYAEKNMIPNRNIVIEKYIVDEEE